MLLPAHAQFTVPQPLDMLVPHAVPHFGSAQQAPFTHVEPEGHVNVRAPQEFVAVPQKSAVGLSGSAQQAPGPALPEVLQASPLPHEVDEQVLVPQLLFTSVLHAAPTPPQVGSVQQEPGTVVSG